MMKVVAPQSVDAVAARFRVHYVMYLLPFILAEDQNRSLTGGVARFACKPGYDMLLGIVDNGMTRVDAQSVKMKLANPIGGVRCDKISNVRAMFAVEIDRVTPLRVMLLGNEVGRERAGVIAARPEVVIDRVENHADS